MKFKASFYKQCLVFTVILASCIHIYFLSVRSKNSDTPPLSSHSSEVTHLKNVPIVNSKSKWVADINSVEAISTQISNDQKWTTDSEKHINVTLHSDFIPSSGIVILPSFSRDESEYIFGSMIEREAESYNLYLTTFFICHQQLIKSSSHRKINPFVRKSWNKMATIANSAKYLPSGQRVTSPAYYCRIKVSQFSPDYVVQGMFVPNHLSTDKDTNQVLDVLRCPLQQSKLAYDKFGHTDEDIHVDIMRDGITLISFAVPWKYRKTGFLLSNPSISSFISSNVNQWKGYSSGNDKLDKVHICIPGTKRIISKQVWPLFLEFISHHILLGASHIYLPLTLAWSSTKMNSALQLFQRYIHDGSLSVVSMAGDELDLVQSSGGLTWSSYDLKIIHSNMCLYQAKGVAEYVMMLDIDEFFIPKLPHNSIISVIQSVEADKPLMPLTESAASVASSWKAGPGWADGAMHPFCFLLLQSVTLYNQPTKNNKYLPKQDLIGERFNHGYKEKYFGYSKAILPTRYIYQGGLAAPGACALPPHFSPCQDYENKKSMSNTNTNTFSQGFCGDPLGPIQRKGVHGMMKDHSFYEQVSNTHAKVLNPQSEALYYHFRLLQDEPKDTITSHVNEYSSRFFKNTIADLRRRNIHLLTLLEDAKRDATDDTDSYSEKAFKMIQSWVPLVVSNNNNKQQQSYDGIIHNVTISPECPTRSIPYIKSLSNHSNIGQIMKLPSLASDDSDYALGAMIERVSDSYDLYLTTFFLCQNLLQYFRGGSEGSVESISPDVFDLWNIATENIYSAKDHSYSTGERKQPPTIQCKITPADGYESYIVGGRFVPNRLTSDANANRRLDIFRCKMKDTKDAYFKLARTDAIMTVEILKDGLSSLKFEIPWKTRMTGFMLEPAPNASKFDAWKGFDLTTPGVWKHDDFYMCVPGIEMAPSQKSMAPFLEFVQHHLLLGMNHMFIGVLLGEESHHMKIFKRVLQSFVDDGSVSIVSTSADGFDGVYSLHGLSWGRDNIKNMHVNMCTYIAKGVAEYVGVWDNDEFLIPRGNNKNIMDIIRGVESHEPIPPSYVHTLGTTDRLIKDNWKSGRGLADGDGHPFCSIIFNSDVKKSPLSKSYDFEHPWIGERYSHPAEPFNEKKPGMGFKKSIRPTRKIFMAGLHIVGACRLEPEWTPCYSNMTSLDADGFCWGQENEYGVKDRFSKSDGFDFHINHRFDEKLTENDSKFVNHLTEGVIYHIQINRPWMTININKINMNKTSEYTSHYFPNVLKHLNQRGLVLPITLPFTIPSNIPSLLTSNNYNSSNNSNENNWTNISIDFLSQPSSSSIVTIDTSKTNISNLVSLPQWNDDGSELVLGSIIERTSSESLLSSSSSLSITTNQTIPDLYLASFLLTHQSVNQAERYINNINNSTYSINSWRQFFKSSSTLNSNDSSSTYGCTIRNSKNSLRYYVKAEVISNEQSTNTAESPVTILRCKMQTSDIVNSISSLLGENVLVDLHKGDTHSASFISFSVPWETRINSKLLEPSNSSSTFNSWTDYVASVYSVTATTGLPPSKSTIAYYIEHVQHMVNLGVRHIFLPVQFKWRSVHMIRLTKALRSFIREGLLTITSMSIDDMNFQSAFAGAIWNQLTANTIHTLMCVYLLKGITPYVVTPEINHFFIPNNSNNNSHILDTIPKSISISSSCIISFKTKKVLNIDITPSESETSWIGHKFAHGAEINDDENIDINSSVAMILTKNFHQLQYDINQNRFICPSINQSMESTSSFLNKQGGSYFYQFVSDEYSINHEVQLHENDYSKYYSSSVIHELTKRNLDLLIDLPKETKIVCVADEGWTPYKKYFEYIMKSTN